jgi:hypothetical protein
MAYADRRAAAYVCVFVFALAGAKNENSRKRNTQPKAGTPTVQLL